jgi:hypothetical protein
MELAADNREAPLGKGDRHVDVDLTQGGATRHQQLEGVSRREERRGPAAGLSSSYATAGKHCAEGLNNFCILAAFLDRAMVTMPYPTATHYRHAHLILESASLGQRKGPHSKSRVLDGRAIGGWRVRPLVGFPDRYSGTRQEEATVMAGTTFQPSGRSVSFFCVVVSVLPKCLRGDGGP